MGFQLTVDSPISYFNFLNFRSSLALAPGLNLCIELILYVADIRFLKYPSQAGCKRTELFQESTSSRENMDRI